MNCRFCIDRRTMKFGLLFGEKPKSSSDDHTEGLIGKNFTVAVVTPNGT